MVMRARLVAMPRIDRRFALISGVARAELVLWCRGYELWECLIVGWVGVRRRVHLLNGLRHGILFAAPFVGGRRRISRTMEVML